MNKLFLDYQTDIINKLAGHHFVLQNSKIINYGIQLDFINNEKKIKLTLYYNSKNQFKYVLNKIEPYDLKNQIISIINGNVLFSLADEKTEYNLWAGSDESGKGDYFGPLTVVAFACNKSSAEKLQKMGVQDSKKMKDEQIVNIAKKVFVDFKGYYNYFILMPEQYNKLYEKFTLSGQKLNEMLAWLHSRVLGDLYQKHKFECAVIDKFANEKVISRYVSKSCDCKLDIRPYAEEDIAVATASVLARYLFISKMEELSKQFNIKILKGASTKVKQLRNDIISNDANILPFIAKMHFKMDL